jgi:hypothetical protein
MVLLVVRKFLSCYFDANAASHAVRVRTRLHFL